MGNMTSLNSSLPQALKDFVEQKRQAADKLEALLLEGLNSGTPVEITPEYWEQKRQSLIARHGKKTGHR